MSIDSPANSSPDLSGLLAEQAMLDAADRAYTRWRDSEGVETWLDELRQDFHYACDSDRPDAAVALVNASLQYALTADGKYDLLHLQGVGLGKMLDDGGPAELFDYQIASFESAFRVLPENKETLHRRTLIRLLGAKAWQRKGFETQGTEALRVALGALNEILPIYQSGALGYPAHAKAAEVATLIASTAQSLSAMGQDIDPLPRWLLALKLALDPELRAADTLGYWNAAIDPVEQWLDELRYKPEAKEAGAAVCEVLQALNLPPDKSTHGWAQYYIGVFTSIVGLQADGLRTEAKSEEDADKLTSAVTAYRKALAEIEAGNGGYWPSTAFQLAYAIHALGEARNDIVALNEAIGLYEQVILRLADCIDQEDSLLQAQTQVNLSEAMAQIAEITENGTLARHAMNIAADAEMGFTLWAHDEGIEVAQANIARITGVIVAIEQP